MKTLLLLFGIVLCFTSCMIEKTMQGEETPARLISIDTTMHNGDPIWKTLHWKFITREDLFFDYDFVPMNDTRQVGVVMLIPRPLSHIKNYLQQ